MKKISEQELIDNLFPEKAAAFHKAVELQNKMIASIKHFNSTFFLKDIFGNPIVSNETKKAEEQETI